MPQYPGSTDAFDSLQPPSAPHPASAFNPASGLAYAAMAVAALLLVYEIIDAGLAFAAQDDYLEAGRQGLSALDVFTTYDMIAIATLPIGIAAYVVSCLWLFQVRKNAELLDPGAHHARSRGWVWGSWIVPVVNAWFPYQVVRDISRSPVFPTPGALLGWWWAFWLVYLFTSQIGTRLTGFGEINSGAVRALGTVESINAGFGLAALALWLAIIRHIRRGQAASAEGLAG